MKRILSVVVCVFMISSFADAQSNIAPSATFTASYVSSTLGPTRLNDLDFGTCGTQQMWLRTSTPPSTTAGVEWIAWEWNSPKQIEEIVFHHAQTTGRYMNGATLQIQSGSSWITVHTFSNLTVQCVNRVTFPRVRAQKMRLTQFTVASVGQQSNINFREIELIEAPEYNNDAGIAGLNKPGIPVCSTLDDSLKIVLQNFGIKQLDSCMVNWKVNDTLQTPIRFVGTVPPGGASIVNATYHRTLQIGDSIEIWSTMPNGVQDSLPDNDTLEYVLIDGLSGTYAVGGSSPDYPDLDSAISDLNRRGVCTAVTFELHDMMNMANVPIMHFNGTSAQRLVTFKSASSTNWSYVTDTSSSAANNYSIVLDGASHIKFEEIIFNNSSTGQYAGVVNLTGGNSYIDFMNCEIKSSYSGSSTNAYLVNSDVSSGDMNISFTGCTLEGGSWGISTEGDAQAMDEDWEIRNSIFKNQYRSAIWVNGNIGLEIASNKIWSNSVHSSSSAININEARGYTEVYGNTIYHSPDWPQTGLRMANSSGLSTQLSLVMNNAFSIGDTAGVSTEKRGMHFDGVGFFDIRFNTVAVGSSNNNSYAFKIENANGNKVHNNVFANMNTGGVAVNVSGLGSILTMDNNLLYAMSGDLGEFNSSSLNSLSSWQNNTGFDANSVSSDPLFRSIDTLKMCNKDADNIGLSSGLVVDFDGNLRDANTPDPGAFEYSAISGISVADQRICNGDTATFFVGAGKSDVLIWNFADTGKVFMTPNKGTYTLTAYGECGADTTTFDVDINALVELPADTNICSGDTLMVMASLNNGTYTWSNGSTGQNVGIHMPGEYYVNVVDSDGCWSTDTMEVTVSAAVWLRSDTTVCSGATVELDPGTAGGTYTWFRNGTSFSTATKVFADSAGEYSVSYTDAKNCTSTDTFMLTIAAQPNARFTVSQLSNSSNLRFEAVDTTGSNYYWSFGDGKSVSGPSWFTLNQYLANGSYSVTLVMTSQLCGDSTYSKEVDVIGIGLSEQLAEQGLKIYPNPTADYVTVDLSQIELDLRLELVSMSGQKMFSSSLNSLSTNKIEFNKNLSSGLYVINIMDSENNLVYTQTLSIK